MVLLLFAMPAYSGIANDNDANSLTLVYDYWGGEQKTGLCKDWGFSMLVRFDGKTILFDCGTNEEIILSNLKELGIIIKDIDFLVLSHPHPDHTGGIYGILKENQNIKVCASWDMPDIPEMTILNIQKPTFITPNIVLITQQAPEGTGYFGVRETHMVLKTSQGLVIITGCNHPDLELTLRKSIECSNESRIYMVAGGLHLIVNIMHVDRWSIPGKFTDTKTLRQIVDKTFSFEVKYILPAHDTGKEATDLFREKWGNGFIEPNLGMKLNIPSTVSNSIPKPAY